jgi:hypothetical protein
LWASKNEAQEAEMNDPYRIGPADTHTPSPERSRGVLRPVLWLVLIVSAAANAVVSSAIGNAAVGSAFGAVALACAITLIVHHYRTRAR